MRYDQDVFIVYAYGKFSSGYSVFNIGRLSVRSRIVVFYIKHMVCILLNYMNIHQTDHIQSEVESRVVC